MVYTVTARRVHRRVPLAVLALESAMILDGRGLQARHAALTFPGPERSEGGRHAVATRFAEC